MNVSLETSEVTLTIRKRILVPIAVPRPGECIEPARPPQLERWWPSVPWKTAEQDPIVSGGIARRK